MALTKIKGAGINISAAEKLYFDGGGTTYIQESADGVLDFYADNVKMLELLEGGTDYVWVPVDATKFAIGAGKDLNIYTSSDDAIIENITSDKDIIFKGNDGGSTITALTLDISAAGAATFNDKIIATELDISGNMDIDGTSNLDVVDIDGAVDMASTLQVDGAITSSAGATITTADNLDTLTLISTDADANVGPNLRLYRNSGSPADNDAIGTIQMEGRNDNSQDVVYNSIESYIIDASDGTEDTEFVIRSMIGGTLVNSLQMTSAETNINQEGIDIDFRVESNNNANMLFVDGGNDRVGIGTSPSRLFQLHSGGSGDTCYMQFTQDGTGATSGDGLLIGINANEQAIIYNQENTDLMLYTNQVERMRLDTSGKVGIGENSPDQLLHVTASSGDPYIVCETASGGGAGIKLVGTDTNNKIQSSGGIDFYTGSSTTANGNLKVSIESGGRIRCTDGIYDDTGTNELVLHANVSGGVGGLYTAQSIALGIWTSNAQRMHITSGGKVGIGTNDPDAHLSVVAAGTDGAGLGRFESTASSGTPEGINVYYPSVAPDNDGWSFLHQDSGATRFIVRNDGDVENHDNDYGATSDERIKDNITDAKSQWDDIKALKVRNFQRKDDIDQYGEDKAMVQIGVIAQEVELISSGLIEEKRPSDYEKDVLKIDGDVKVMKYSVLYMKAIKCLQEAMERIEALENA